LANNNGQWNTTLGHKDAANHYSTAATSYHFKIHAYPTTLDFHVQTYHNCFSTMVCSSSAATTSFIYMGTHFDHAPSSLEALRKPFSNLDINQ
jgi:hypothetical protein